MIVRHIEIPTTFEPVPFSNTEYWDEYDRRERDKWRERAERYVRDRELVRFNDCVNEIHAVAQSARRDIWLFAARYRAA